MYFKGSQKYYFSSYDKKFKTVPLGKKNEIFFLTRFKDLPISQKENAKAYLFTLKPTTHDRQTPLMKSCADIIDRNKSNALIPSKLRHIVEEQRRITMDLLPVYVFCGSHTLQSLQFRLTYFEKKMCIYIFTK